MSVVTPLSNEVAQPVTSRLQDLVGLCRPRIALMSAISVAAGFTLGSTSSLDWGVMLTAICGIVCFVAASSILNQVLERDTDREMDRTIDRPLATGRMSAREGWMFGISAIVVGSVILMSQVNLWTWVVSFLTMVTYVALYTPLKRLTGFCTTIGAIPGAMPPVLGWLAAGREPGIEAVTLFALFFVWQFPHFLAIGWLYREQYRRAGLKMLPSYDDEGMRAGVLALSYAIAFVPICCLPRFIGLAGTGYLCAALVLSFGYLWLTARFWYRRDDFRAKQLMVGSLLCLPCLLLCLVVDFVRLTSSF